MQYYTIGEFVNDSDSVIELFTEILDIQRVNLGPNNLANPFWLLQENQENAWGFTFFARQGEEHIQNQIYFWYEEIDDNFFLLWSTEIGGIGTAAEEPLPVTKSFLRVALKIEGGIIIVGTVDALIEVPTVSTT